MGRGQITECMEGGGRDSDKKAWQASIKTPELLVNGTNIKSMQDNGKNNIWVWKESNSGKLSEWFQKQKE